MEKKQLAPIVIFVYARPKHTKDTIEALANNELAKESNVWIFSDNYKNDKSKENVEKVRQYINSIKEKKWFNSVTVVEAPKNQGLANSVINGVTEVINKYGKVIVVEDDLVTSKYFIKYMNEALDFYENDEKIWSISGYNPPIEIPKNYEYDVYLGYRGNSWGWATWRDRWDTVDWEVKDYKKFKHNIFKRRRFNKGGPDRAQILDSQMRGKCDSWAVRFGYAQSKQKKYSIYPVESLVSNKGLDGTGTHRGNTTNFDIKLSEKSPKLQSDLKFNKVITKNFYNQFNSGIKQKVLELINILGMEGVLEKARAKREK